MLKAYKKPKDTLGTAEKFFLLLIDLPGYKVRIEGMILALEFPADKGSLDSDIQAMLSSVRGILDSTSLVQFLRFALHTGNFINAVRFCYNLTSMFKTKMTLGQVGHLGGQISRVYPNHHAKARKPSAELTNHSRKAQWQE